MLIVHNQPIFIEELFSITYTGEHNNHHLQYNELQFLC